MDHQEQTKAFANDLDALVDRYEQEFDITYAQVVGCLQMKIFLLCQQAGQNDGDEE